MHTEWYRGDPEDYIRKMNGTDTDPAAYFTVIRTRGCSLDCRKIHLARMQARYGRTVKREKEEKNQGA